MNISLSGDRLHQSIAQAFNDDPLWGLVLGSLIRESAAPGGEWSKAFSGYMGLSLLSMAQEIVGRQKLKLSIPRKMKPFYQTQGRLLARLRLLITAIQGTHARGTHPALIFHAVLMEREILGVVATLENDPDISTRTELSRQLSRQNRSLRSFQNPFKAPNTQALFDIAVRIAEGDTTFYQQVFKPFVMAREAVSLAAKQETAWIEHQEKPRQLRQGRKKMISETLAV